MRATLIAATAGLVIAGTVGLMMASAAAGLMVTSSSAYGQTIDAAANDSSAVATGGPAPLLGSARYVDLSGAAPDPAMNQEIAGPAPATGPVAAADVVGPPPLKGAIALNDTASNLMSGRRDDSIAKADAP